MGSRLRSVLIYLLAITGAMLLGCALMFALLILPALVRTFPPGVA